jgi:hypothetical protein
VNTVMNFRAPKNVKKSLNGCATDGSSCRSQLYAVLTAATRTPQKLCTDIALVTDPQYVALETKSITAPQTIVSGVSNLDTWGVRKGVESKKGL